MDRHRRAESADHSVARLGDSYLRDTACSDYSTSVVTQCLTCVVGSGADFHKAQEEPIVVVHISDEAIVLVSSDVDGVLVAPRHHVNGLSELKGKCLPTFLATLQRTALSVRTLMGASGTQIETWLSIPESDGHVCFRLSATYNDAAQASDLAELDQTRGLARSFGPSIVAPGSVVASTLSPGDPQVRGGSTLR